MPEVRAQDLQDCVLVSSLIGYYYEDKAPELHKPFQNEVTTLAKTVELLPLIYDKLIIGDLKGFPIKRKEEYLAAQIAVTPVYVKDEDFGTSSAEFMAKMSQAERDELDKLNIVRVNASEISHDPNYGLLDKLFGNLDKPDVQGVFRAALLAVLDDYHFMERNNAQRATSWFAWTMCFDLINSMQWNIPVYTKMKHMKVWESMLQLIKNNAEGTAEEYGDLIRDVNQRARSIAILNAFLQNVNLLIPFGLEIDDVITFRKDKARNNFKEWLFSRIDAPIADFSDIGALGTKIVSEFNELSRSVIKQRDSRSDLLNASLSGFLTGVASLIYPILSIPAGTLAPLLLDKPLLRLCTSLMKKRSKNNWALFFSEFKTKQQNE